MQLRVVLLAGGIQGMRPDVENRWRHNLSYSGRSKREHPERGPTEQTFFDFPMFQKLSSKMTEFGGLAQKTDSSRNLGPGKKIKKDALAATFWAKGP